MFSRGSRILSTAAGLSFAFAFGTLTAQTAKPVTYRVIALAEPPDVAVLSSIGGRAEEAQPCVVRLTLPWFVRLTLWARPRFASGSVAAAR